jgi:hypothetical protein
MKQIQGERLPLKGLRYWRWVAALRICNFACFIGGRHRWTLEWNREWKTYHCTVCGQTEEPPRDGVCE